MNLTPMRKLSSGLEEDLRFFKTWMDSPKAIGNILPTGQQVARRMASVIDIDSGLPVLELGPGTGPITRAILKRGVKPQALYSVEYTASLIPPLKAAHPEVNFIQGDAFDLETTLGEHRDLVFDCVVSSLPLLNFPKSARQRLILDLLERIPAGRPVVQFSYGAVSPVPVDRKARFRIESLDWVVRNLPPARVWVYRKP